MKYIPEVHRFLRFVQKYFVDKTRLLMLHYPTVLPLGNVRFIIRQGQCRTGISDFVAIPFISSRRLLYLQDVKLGIILS